MRTYQEGSCREPLFERALGDAFARMPHSIRELHCPRETTTFKGVAQIDKAANPVGTLVARLFGFPAAGSDVPVEVKIEPQVDGEIWHRCFGRSRFSSALAIDALAHTSESMRKAGLHSMSRLVCGESEDW